MQWKAEQSYDERKINEYCAANILIENNGIYVISWGRSDLKTVLCTLNRDKSKTELLVALFAVRAEKTANKNCKTGGDT